MATRRAIAGSVPMAEAVASLQAAADPGSAARPSIRAGDWSSEIDWIVVNMRSEQVDVTCWGDASPRYISGVRRVDLELGVKDPPGIGILADLVEIDHVVAGRRLRCSALVTDVRIGPDGAARIRCSVHGEFVAEEVVPQPAATPVVDGRRAISLDGRAGRGV